ncbi:uncharacterized protein K489DRAFT_310030 [Dissoconium aciculare CBS 342.82]|uniref:TRIP4/RQT4 C2HC5-type zinc finger domain-containing protein n=1 Tax=Dissoconium aciculare CBS 342.82 TaxID=1314786 RepID=A0A6J3MI92_9PEZI|nr:uncharacterized protein K489DRAFT_310030 [Dissoconium aciculare CBS 342.82]KAF1827646.1 hypothetical protein K489DRAFT_310030 [Dissoconium aciculare CBS 342.82]
MAASVEQWAVPRLSQILGLDQDSAQAVIAYTNSLSKQAAADHLAELMGGRPQVLEFITSYNQRRQEPSVSTPPSEAPTNATTPQPAGPGPSQARQPRKKKPQIHALPPRRIADSGDVAGAYQKRNEDDYMPTAARQRHKDQVADNLALRQKPDATKLPLITDDASLTTKPITSKAPPSAAGPLISDALSSKKGGSSQSSKSSAPATKTKVNITGGTAMHGASTALSDLDSAIRSLELQTNPAFTTSAIDNKERMCNCMATRHPLLDVAPNCLNCGKVICIKQGLGPCTFCNTPLLNADDIQKVLRVLKEERGEERMKANNATHKRADVAQGKARAYTGRDFLANAAALSGRSSAAPSPLSSTAATPAGSDDEAGAKAQAHRDKLLNFQANNARRTHIRDEAADYDIPTAGTNMWASPAERAQQLKKQQKALREIEWNARPEYEKRKVVASIDLVGGRIVKRMAEVENPDFNSNDDGKDDDDYAAPVQTTGGGGAFSRNPLASGLIRPVAREAKGKDTVREKRTTWRRVQMDEDDNEQWILDGGVYGGNSGDRELYAEEPACG